MNCLAWRGLACPVRGRDHLPAATSAVAQGPTLATWHTCSQRRHALSQGPQRRSPQSTVPRDADTTRPCGEARSCSRHPHPCPRGGPCSLWGASTAWSAGSSVKAVRPSTRPHGLSLLLYPTPTPSGWRQGQTKQPAVWRAIPHGPQPSALRAGGCSTGMDPTAPAVESRGVVIPNKPL